jgi:hypothetical protein
LIIDGGANEGQYGSDLISEGINLNNSNILSFEPLSKPFKKLDLISKKHKQLLGEFTYVYANQ